MMRVSLSSSAPSWARRRHGNGNVNTPRRSHHPISRFLRNVQLWQVLGVRRHERIVRSDPAAMTSPLWQHGRVRRVTVLLALLGAAFPGCRLAARELAPGPAGAAGPRELVQALADRFGP